MKTLLCTAILGISLSTWAPEAPSMSGFMDKQRLDRRLASIETRLRHLEAISVTHTDLDLRLQSIERRCLPGEALSGAEIVAFARVLAQLKAERDLARAMIPDPNRPSRLTGVLEEARRAAAQDPNRPNRLSRLLAETAGADANQP